MKKNLFLLLGLLMSFNVMAQTKTITGTVVDATNEPVIGASVVEAGTTNGTITDLDGKFSLNVSQGAKINVSYIGYKTQHLRKAKIKIKVCRILFCSMHQMLCSIKPPFGIRYLCQFFPLYHASGGGGKAAGIP